MIRMTQIKIPIEQVAEVSDREKLRHGILSEAERRLVIQKAAEWTKFNYTDWKTDTKRCTHNGTGWEADTK